MIFNLTNTNGTDDEQVRGLYIKLFDNQSNDILNLTIEFCSRHGTIKKNNTICGSYYHSAMNFKDENKTTLNPEGAYTHLII